jgi:hypothetical protein
VTEDPGAEDPPHDPEGPHEFRITLDGRIHPG